MFRGPLYYTILNSRTIYIYIYILYMYIHIVIANNNNNFLEESERKILEIFQAPT